MGVMGCIGVQPSRADEDVRMAMKIVKTALNEHISKCRLVSDADKTSKVLFHQMIDFVLADWSVFFSPLCLKYKKVFQRALQIQPQMAQLDEESFDIDRHQHDLECLARIASSIKRTEVEEEIRKRLPYQSQVNNATLVNGEKIKKGWIKLKDEGVDLIGGKEWELAMFRFSQAIIVNSEEGSLYYLRAMCEIQLSKFQLAFEDAQDAIELNPKCAEFRNVLSEASLGLRLSETKFVTKLRPTVQPQSSKAVLQENQQENLKEAEGTFPSIQRAAEKGLVDAQYRFGLLLIYGDGCPRHELLAKKWLMKAHAQGFRPEKAKKTWVDDIVRNAKSLICFESQNNINVNGLSLAKRVERFDSFTRFKFDSLGELLDSAIKFETRLPIKQSNSIIMKPVIEKWLPLMMKRARHRSLKAQSFFISHGLVMKAQKLLLQNKTIESFRTLREARRIWDCPIIDISIFFHAAEEMLKKNFENAEAYHVLISSNKTSSSKNRLWMAMQSVELDPSVADFHYALSRVYVDMGDYQRALRSIDRALQLSVCPDWLYERASLIRLNKNKDDSEVISAYKKYLSCSQPDDFHVPDAHYSIALAYYVMGRRANSKNFSISLKDGLKAESSETRLPCFLPVSKCGCVAKELLKNILKRIIPVPEDNKENEIRISEVFCVVCLKGNPSTYCLFCRKWVCGREEHYLTDALHDCQVSHVAQHKSAILTSSF